MSNNFFPPENRAVYEIILKKKKKIQPDMPQIKYNMAHELLHTCWIPKVTDTHSEYVNTYCFSRTNVVSRTRMSYTYINCVAG